MDSVLLITVHQQNWKERGAVFGFWRRNSCLFVRPGFLGCLLSNMKGKFITLNFDLHSGCAIYCLFKMAVNNEFSTGSDAASILVLLHDCSRRLSMINSQVYNLILLRLCLNWRLQLQLRLRLDYIIMC